MNEKFKGKLIHDDDDMSIEIVNPNDAPDDLRIVFTDMFHKQTLSMIHDADRAALFRDMSARDQVACIQSGILGALCLYLSASTPTKHIQDLLTASLLKALPLVMNAAQRHVAEIRLANNLPPIPEE